MTASSQEFVNVHQAGQLKSLATFTISINLMQIGKLINSFAFNIVGAIVNLIS